VKYRGIGFAVPLCRWPLLRLCGFSSSSCRRIRSSFRLRPLFELVLSFRVLPSHTYPAVATAKSSHGLWFPSALEAIRGPLAAGPEPARYVPPSGFGYPLGGLLPRIPCRFCFAPAALVGFTLRRFRLSGGVLAFPPRTDPHTFHSLVAFAAEASNRPSGLRFPGPFLPRVPGGREAF
jgi:hypothetical protein